MASQTAQQIKEKSSKLGDLLATCRLRIAGIIEDKCDLITLEKLNQCEQELHQALLTLANYDALFVGMYNRTEKAELAIERVKLSLREV